MALQTAERALEELRNGLSGPPALERIASAFGLTPFERELLLLCAGAELDQEVGHLLGVWHGVSSLARPTFACAMAVLDAGHLDALRPTGPLRQYELLQLAEPSAFMFSPLVLRERILHGLLGVDELDPLLRLYMSRQTVFHEMAPSHEALAVSIAESLSRTSGTEMPAIVISGGDRWSKRGIAAVAAKLLGWPLYVFPGENMPSDLATREKLARIWECEKNLARCALYLDGEQLETPAAVQNACSFAERLSGPLFLSGKCTTYWNGPTVHVVVKPLPASEQRSLWKETLGPVANEMETHLDRVVSNFSLRVTDISGITKEAVLPNGALNADGLAKRIWESCRARARPRLDELADRIEALASWDDLVLPYEELHTLRRIAARARRRYQVLEHWGFAEKTARGLGSSVLFAGVSGTGKTMAAEILANELSLDLYRVDLSRVVSKYIGETEKNLARIFDAADEGGVVLLFDEADALFGKRSEVRDSHDRHANIEVSYLLQRMEAYQGVAILTTNIRSALDEAFLRRLRYVVTFPFPGMAERAEIWRRVFPRQTPTEGLDYEKLSRLPLAGGNIRNIALNAAFGAADAGMPVGMTHVREAAWEECVKLDKGVFLPDLAGWA